MCTRGLAPFHKHISTDGRSITVTYTGSECRDGSRFEVDEQDEPGSRDQRPRHAILLGLTARAVGKKEGIHV